VRLELDLNGILKVTATERATGLAKHVVIDNAMERFRLRQRSDALERLDAAFDNLAVEDKPLTALEGPDQEHELDNATVEDARLQGVRQATVSAHTLLAKAKGLLPSANAEDAEELRAMLTDLEAALARGVEDDIRAVSREVEEIVFYLEDV
jgi:molecular chaperone DnaK